MTRRAAIRYQAALVAAQQDLLAQLESLRPALLSLPADELDRLEPETPFLVRAHRHLATIRRLEFAAVISAGNTNQDSTWQTWSDAPKTRVRIARFKKPLSHPDPTRQDGLAILCVKSMLLTGFDAPREQVLYLDRFMQGHELLQAIARVNRTAAEKTHGLVVDYFGVTDHLSKALAAYSAEDVQGSLTDVKDELPKLADRHRRVLSVFSQRGLNGVADVDACIDLLGDPKLRHDFVTRLKQFLQTLDTVLPRPEALPYLRDARIFGWINKASHNRYRDDQLNLIGAGNKVRELIDDYVVSQGVDPKIPPISILDANFDAVVAAHASDRAKASEMEHAARHYITVHYQEDPVYYQKLSE
ncbi:MAG TPA: restriction endonuclease subunit R, partial [Chloroflexota bacterium]|nr:restriction endonuclease subunit R [Chloroflexota bacterium]